MLCIKHIFIVNPCSGKKKSALAYLPIIENVAKKLNLSYELHETKARNHACEIVTEIAEKGDEVRFYAIGGDGTLNEVFCGAYKFENAQVASVPCGSGNDYVKNFGETKYFRDLEDNISGTSVKVDLIQVNDKICHDISSIGLDANVAKSMIKFKNLPFVSGKLAYNLAIINEVLKPLGQDMHIEIDGEPFDKTLLLCALCNGKTYGGGIKASKYSNLHDGVLEFIYANKISKLKIAKVINDYKSGVHLINETQIRDDLKDIIYIKKCKSIVVKKQQGGKVAVNIDGEIFDYEIFNAHILPSAANFTVPKSLYQEYVENNQFLLQKT